MFESGSVGVLTKGSLCFIADSGVSKTLQVEDKQNAS